MADFEVHIDLDGRTRPIGLARTNRVRGAETILFEYDGAWLEDPDRFSLEPALQLTRGAFAPLAGLATFGSIGDSAPDTWGRRLMQRVQRRLAEREGRAVRTLVESDYLLGVADETRLGALRFRWVGDEVFQAPIRAGVPALIELGRLLEITERILRDEETDEDLRLIFAPGSSLGGARPKASVTDQHGHLSIAKFPKEIDEAAMMDGRSRLGAFFFVVAPLAAPGIGATAVLCFILSWNEFLYAFILVAFEGRPLTVGIPGLVTPHGTLWGQVAAVAIVATLPIVLFTFLVQKQLVRGLTFGAVKG
ncbi:MAG: ABC transporter permease subunit, partial [Mesorhizobium sp.]|nr:ABC transporter permease subunit [Mesorhizobium sp.]